jgi:cation diffusion facilitator CzcD-associated flavoprotein CzcO
MPGEPRTTEEEHVDVLVVGAGIAGINAAHHLAAERPGAKVVVLDALDNFGGTWWTHRFPGVRSDTEVFTLGFEHKPWTGAPYATGAEIHAYLGEVVADEGFADRIRYRHRLVAASWSGDDRCWTLTVDRPTGDGEGTGPVTMTASFLWMCHGYYRHDQGHTPSWPGAEEFEGTWIHPQHWPDDADLAGKRVVVIGSGATAATLIPEIAHECAHVTMLQRSPTYYFQSPNVDELADQLRSLDTPPEWIHQIVRRKAVDQMQALTQVAADFPEATKAGLVSMVAAQLPEGYDVGTHFTPRHDPHEQRICRILDGDLFAAIRDGSVDVVTDEIDRFTPTGIRTRSGTEVDADVVVTATGFDLSIFGGVDFTVDGRPVDFAECVTYRGILFAGVPNMAWSFGALRLSWTMRVEMVSRYVCRLLAHLEEVHATSVVPRLRPADAGMELTPFVDPDQFRPGYLLRSAELVPRSGSVPEWQLSLDYWEERDVLPDARFDDGCLVFTSAP